MGRVTNKLLATKQYKKPRTLNIYTLVILTQATNKNNVKAMLCYGVNVMLLVLLAYDVMMFAFFTYISVMRDKRLYISLIPSFNHACLSS